MQVSGLPPHAAAAPHLQLSTACHPLGVRVPRPEMCARRPAPPWVSMHGGCGSHAALPRTLGSLGTSHQAVHFLEVGLSTLVLCPHPQPQPCCFALGLWKNLPTMQLLCHHWRKTQSSSHALNHAPECVFSITVTGDTARLCHFKA